ncbi:MAG: hypothetical protein IIC64_10165 [SAR324 cluster bacterium]|nr:hypothetical protein [SAR324 cluster bacterium]
MGSGSNSGSNSVQFLEKRNISQYVGIPHQTQRIAAGLKHPGRFAEIFKKPENPGLHPKFAIGTTQKFRHPPGNGLSVKYRQKSSPCPVEWTAELRPEICKGKKGPSDKAQTKPETQVTDPWLIRSCDRGMMVFSMNQQVR